MRIIKKLAEQINEEVDGAIDYAMEALDCKVEDPELSRFYFELAKTEYGHMEKLHDHVLRKIKEAREEGQATRNMLQENKIEALRDRVGQLETAQMLNPIEARLAQVPTYPNGYVYNAGPNPFCACNQGCGNI